MTLVVHTAAMWYRGEDRLDITVMGHHPVGRAFAPDPEAFRAYLTQRRTGTATLADWEGYVSAYFRRLGTVPSSLWADLLSRSCVTLVCFCPTVDFCHRRLLAENLTTRGATYRGERPHLRRGDAAE